MASRDGNVARLVERDGQPLTAAEDADERERLNDLIASPDDFYRHHRKDLDTRESVIKVVGLMPEAMLYSYAPGQPQLKGSQGLGRARFPSRTQTFIRQRCTRNA